MSEDNYVIAPPPRPAIAVIGTDKTFPVRRIWCVGRNYEEHIREMGQDVRDPSGTMASAGFEKKNGGSRTS